MMRATRNIAARVVMAAALLLAGTGCTDLLVEPKSTVTGANVFTSLASYRSFLARIYAGLAVTGQQGPAGRGDIQGIDEGFSHYLRLLWQMNELPTDEAVIAWGDGPLQELNRMDWGATNDFLVSMYYRIFFQVAMANEFLRETADAKLDSRGVSAADKSVIAQYRAEARFLRALSYWHAMDLFGNVPLVDENFPVGATPPPQATRTEIYQFVVSELTAIKGQLAARPQYGRAGQAAASMLLAHVYMNAGVYTGTPAYGNALTEAQSVITSGYSLDPNWHRMFLADNHTSPEMIFAVPQDGLRTQSWGGTTFLCHASVGGNMDQSKYGLDFGWWGLRTTQNFVALWPGGVNTTDPRAKFWTSGQNLVVNNLTNFFDGIAILKYQNVTSTGRMGSHLTHVDVDYPMFRLGDAYLLYAEAVLRGGGGSRAQALQYVNALRQRAHGNSGANITDAQLTLDFLLTERARELYWEGHRRTDLIRFGRFSSGVWAWKGGIAAGRATEAFRELYPLPASELVANPNLKQNPGY